MVASAEVEVSKKTASSVVSPLLNFIVVLAWQQLRGDHAVGQACIAEYGGHMVHGLEFLAEGRDIFLRHSLHDHERKRAFAEFVEQNVLSFDGLQIVGQVGQHIIIDARL
jgi:hypothetical protein